MFADATFTNPFVLNNPKSSRKTNEVYLLVKKELAKVNIRIEKATPIKFAGDIVGYIVDLDSDGYSVLSKLKTARDDSS